MTSDEKALVERLDAPTQYPRSYNEMVATGLEASALIRRQSEEIDMLARALVTADIAMAKLSDGSTVSAFREVYAAALAIAKERA